MTQHKIVAEHDATDSVSLLEKSLYTYNLAQTGLAEYHPMLFCVRDEADGYFGGVAGYAWGGWRQITMLWLHEDVRGAGLGLGCCARPSSSRANTRAATCSSPRSISKRPRFTSSKAIGYSRTRAHRLPRG
jgi:hypothetical protein